MSADEESGAVASPARLATAASRYRVEHETRYAYRVPVAQSWQLAHLTPRQLPWQRLLHHALTIEPAADERREARDSFGNDVIHFAIHGPHALLRLQLTCEVEVSARPDPAPANGLPWDSVAARLRSAPAEQAVLAARLSEPSALVPWSEAARAYARPSLAAGRDWLEAVSELMHRIHADFEFKPGATTVATQVDEVLALKSGVCQDFAHVMLSCLRGHGLPARYVSGYLHPTPDAEVGVTVKAESHAWIEVWLGAWWGYDPTNAVAAGERHVLVGRGREYGDVAPLKGIYSGHGSHALGVQVELTRLS